jgi:undecaprenol kinase
MNKLLKKFFMGFFYAGRGVISGFTERNMKFHGVATLGVIILGLACNLNMGEWVIILILIGLIWSAEMVNTSIEELANIAKKENNLSYEATTRLRDVAAGSVLVLAIVAAIIGLMIFGPKII